MLAGRTCRGRDVCLAHEKPPHPGHIVQHGGGGGGMRAPVPTQMAQTSAESLETLDMLQVCLAHKKHPPPNTLQ